MVDRKNVVLTDKSTRVREVICFPGHIYRCSCNLFESIGILLLVFFAPTRYRVVKITHFSSEVVLRTTGHMVIYPGSDSSLEVIILC
jgi:hypothetical protein